MVFAKKGSLFFSRVTEQLNLSLCIPAKRQAEHLSCILRPETQFPVWHLSTGGAGEQVSPQGRGLACPHCWRVAFGHLFATFCEKNGATPSLFAVPFVRTIGRPPHFLPYLLCQQFGFCPLKECFTASGSVIFPSKVVKRLPWPPLPVFSVDSGSFPRRRAAARSVGNAKKHTESRCWE